MVSPSASGAVCGRTCGCAGFAKAERGLPWVALDMYHQRRLLGVFLRLCDGCFSSRKLVRSTHGSAGLRLIAANDHPDHDMVGADRRQEALRRTIRAADGRRKVERPDQPHRRELAHHAGRARLASISAAVPGNISDEATAPISGNTFECGNTASHQDCRAVDIVPNQERIRFDVKRMRFGGWRRAAFLFLDRFCLCSGLGIGVRFSAAQFC